MPNDVSQPTTSKDDPTRARALRERLVHSVVVHGVRDERVLEAMREVPRHRFVPEHDLEQAYGDFPLSIGHDATISQPSLVAIMSQALELSGKERVLEIGTGSGYQSAVLCRLAAHVDTVEVVPALARRAASVLRSLHFDGVDVHLSDGWGGLPEHAPYDRVVVTAAPEVLPKALFEQLAEGGLLVVPVGSQACDQRLERWRKVDKDHYAKQDLGAVRFVPMVHASSSMSSRVPLAAFVTRR